jgi:hypothetical protein
VYAGKENSTESSLGARVVKDLTSHIKGKNHHVFFDNFSTGTKMILDLLADGIYACGTVNSNHKGFLTDMKLKRLEKRLNSFFFFSSNN